jgi:hypothetical protein
MAPAQPQRAHVARVGTGWPPPSVGCSDSMLTSVCIEPEQPKRYSHSIVPGGLEVMSSTTRLTSRSSLIMREAIVSSRS